MKILLVDCFRNGICVCVISNFLTLICELHEFCHLRTAEIVSVCPYIFASIKYGLRGTFEKFPVSVESVDMIYRNIK